MILHSSDNRFGWEEEFFQLDYDVDRIIEEFDRSGLSKKAPFWAKLNKHCLLTGEDYTTPCLMLAMDLCEKEEGSVNWPDIPEKYWKMAYEHFVH